MSAPFYQLDELVISDSSLNLFHSCARKLEFRKFFEYSKREESLPMSVGTALHTGYQNFLIHGNKEQALFEMMLEYPFQYEEYSTSARSLNGCVASLEEMMRFPGFAHLELAYFDIRGEKKPAIEVPFKIKVADFSLDDDRYVPVYYIGFIDVVFYDRIRGKFIVVDIKTTTRNVNDKTPLYKFADQCLPYALVLEQALGQEFKSLDSCYMVVDLDLIAPNVQEYSFVKTEEDIADWARSFSLDLQLLKLYYQTGWFPRRGGSCYSFNRPCQYFDFCATRNHATINKFLSMEKPDTRQPIDPWIETELKLVA